MKTKVCYILPLYEEGTDTHFFYNYELLRLVADELDVFVIIEKSAEKNKKNIKLGTEKVYIQKFKNPILRFLEILFLCFRLRVSSFKNFYSHYSYYGAFASLVVVTIFNLFDLGWWKSGVTHPPNPPSLKVREGGKREEFFSWGESYSHVFYWNRGMPWLFKRSFFEEKLLRFIFKRTILVTSPESLAQEYKKIYGIRNYKIFSNWIDIERYKPQISKEEAKKQLGLDVSKKYVLFVHHLSERKGADFIVPVAERFLEEDVEFLVIGDGPEFENLSANWRMKIENSEANIVLLGKLPQNKVVKYFWASDVFFMPSREEGSPHVILEAMAAGTPFVASRVGGVEELTPPAQEEFLCDSGNTTCFYEKIKTLLTDKKKYQDARNSILFWVHRFSKERGVEEFINIFK